MREEIVLFGKVSSLVGIVTAPGDFDTGLDTASPLDPTQSKDTVESGKENGETKENPPFVGGISPSPPLPAVILLNSGLLHRVGPNRFYVKMARRLAAMGVVALRFDLSGIGDSTVRMDNLPLEKSWVSETQEAMDFLNATRGIEQFILIGICSGAYFALRTAIEDARVVGAIPIEGYGYLTHRYYWSHFVNPTSWWRITTGKKDIRDTIAMAWNLIRSLTAKIGSLFPTLKCGAMKAQVRQPRVNLALDVNLSIERGVDLLLVYAKGGPAYYNFVTHKGQLHASMSSGKLQVEVIEHSDHLFTPLSVQEHLLQVVQNWMQAMAQNRFHHQKS